MKQKHEFCSFGILSFGQVPMATFYSRTFPFQNIFRSDQNFRNTFFLAFRNTKARRLTLKTDKMRAILRKTMSLSLCNTLSVKSWISYKFMTTMRKGVRWNRDFG